MPDNSPKRPLARLFGLYFFAVVLGVLSAWLWLTRVGMAGVDAGVWRVNLLAGSQNADAYTRARISLAAVLALDRSETLYYTTDHDDSGEPLRAECQYLIDGVPPPARWWSITAYAADHFLFANAERRYSVGTETVSLDDNGRFKVMLGPKSSQAETNWIPTTGKGDMRLTLRLYNPTIDIQRRPESLNAPRIQREGSCQ